MEKRNRWKMRLVKPSPYWRSRQSWQPGVLQLTQADLNAVNGNKLRIDDLRVDLIRAKADAIIWRMMEKWK